MLYRCYHTEDDIKVQVSELNNDTWQEVLHRKEKSNMNYACDVYTKE